jgi:hypothetical protein
MFLRHKRCFYVGRGEGGGGFAANKIWEVPQVNLLGINSNLFTFKEKELEWRYISQRS